MREHARAFLAALIAVTAVTIAWSGLERDVSPAHLAAIALLAAAPAIAAPARGQARHVAAGAAALVVVPLIAALATRQSVGDLVTFDGAAWSRVARVIPDGLSAAEIAVVPASPADHPAFVALLEFGLAALAAAICWQLLVRRRATAAVVLAGLGMSYRWTVEPPTRPLVVGLFALIALLGVLALTAWHRPQPRPGATSRAVVVGVVSVAIALAAAAGPAAPGQPWWNWRQWGVGNGSAAAGGLDIAQSYGQLRWPDKPREVMRVSSAQGLSMRAATLTGFDGNAFVSESANGAARPLQVADGTIFVVDDPSDRDTIVQRVRVEGLRSPLLMSGGPPVRFRGRFGGTAAERADTIQVTPSLAPGDEYQATIAPSDPDPATLLTATAYSSAEVPLGMTRLAASFGRPAVDVPVWGSGATPPSDAALGDYAEVRRLTQQIVGDARSPYAAANRIESYLRGARFSYNEAPPFPDPGEPPLRDFLFDTQSGFCQHFAGAMGVMMRSIGIPTRLAVGYARGRLDADSREWVIVDRDAHTWVEVNLPGEGWVSFDPTPGPGRAAFNRVSVSSPRYAPPDVSNPQSQEIAPRPVAPVPDDAPAPREAPSNPFDAADAGAGQSGGGGGRGGLLGAIAVLAVVALAGPWMVRRTQRFWRRHHGDGRHRVLAAAKDVETRARALGFAVPASASPTERAALLKQRFGVDASRLYAMAAAARYSPAPSPAADARDAWRSATTLRRELDARAPLRRRIWARWGLPTPSGEGSVAR